MTATVQDARRRLIWHGLLLLLLGLVTGIAVPFLISPRLGLSAHLAGTLDGMLLILVGVIWTDLRLTPRVAVVTFWLVVWAGYAGWVGLLLAAWFGTSGSTPIAGAGHAGAPWQEALVALTLNAFGLVILVASVLLLYGMSRRARDAR